MLNIPNQVDRIARIKQDLIDRKHDLSGTNSGKIVKQLAYELRSFGAGRLRKTAGNIFENCSVDYIVFPDGQSGDVVGDAGGANIPQWGIELHPEDIEKLVEQKEDPGYLTPIEPEKPPVDLPSDNSNFEKIEKRLFAIESLLTEINISENREIELLTAIRIQLENATKEIIKVLDKFGNLPGLGGIFGKNK